MVALADQSLTKTVDLEAMAWARWLARVLDMLLIGFSLWVLRYAASSVLVAIRFPAWHSPTDWWWNALVLRAALIGLMAAYDVALLSRLGVTPGKWLLGLRVLTSDGDRPTWKAILKRSAILWVAGMGLDVVILGFIAMLMSYARLEAKGATLWDQASSLAVEKKPVAWERWAIAISIVAGFNLFEFIGGIAGAVSHVTP